MAAPKYRFESDSRSLYKQLRCRHVVGAMAGTLISEPLEDEDPQALKRQLEKLKAENIFLRADLALRHM